MIVPPMTVAFGSHPDGRFCPAAPSPQQYTENLGIKVGADGRLSHDTFRAQAVVRLIDTRIAGSNATIGWLYLAEDGTSFVQLKSSVARDVYVAFRMPRYNYRRRGSYTQPVLEPVLRLPASVEIRSCNEPD